MHTSIRPFPHLRVCRSVPCRVCRWERRDGRQIIVSGTLERLVAQLIESNQSEKLAVLTGYTGPDYVYTFLLSHTYFTTSTIFLEKLQEHYFASPPPGLGPGELKVIESKQLGTQTRFPSSPLPSLSCRTAPLMPPLMPHRTVHTRSLRFPACCRCDRVLTCGAGHRIVNTLKRWIDNHHYFFEQDSQLVKAFEEFMTRLEQHGDKHQEWAAALRVRVTSRPPAAQKREGGKERVAHELMSGEWERIRRRCWRTGRW